MRLIWRKKIKVDVEIEVDTERKEGGDAEMIADVEKTKRGWVDVEVEVELGVEENKARFGIVW